MFLEKQKRMKQSHFRKFEILELMWKKKQNKKSVRGSKDIKSKHELTLKKKDTNQPSQGCC
jgi:hypothetical protein